MLHTVIKFDPCSFCFQEKEKNRKYQFLWTICTWCQKKLVFFKKIQEKSMNIIDAILIFLEIAKSNFSEEVPPNVKNNSGASGNTKGENGFYN